MNSLNTIINSIFIPQNNNQENELFFPVVHKKIKEISKAKNKQINAKDVAAAVNLTMEGKHVQAQYALYKAFGIDEQHLNTVKKYEKLSGLVWGLNTFPLRLPIFGINSLFIAIIKQVFNLFLSPSIGGMLDKVLGDVANQMILPAMPQLANKHNFTYAELLKEFSNLQKEILAAYKIDEENNFKALAIHFKQEYQILKNKLTIQNENIKFAAYGLGSIERSLMGAASTIVISILSLTHNLTLKQNIAIISGIFILILTASAFSRSTQQRMTNKYNLQFAEILTIEGENKYNNKQNVQAKDIIIENVKPLILTKPLIEYKLIQENYTHKLSNIQRKIDENHPDIEKLSRQLHELIEQIIHFEEQINGNITENYLTKDSIIFQNLSSKQSLFIDNISATWSKTDVLIGQLCKLYGISFQTLIASPVAWSLLADITRYGLLPNQKIDAKKAKIIFATGKIISGVMTSLSNMFSSSARKEVSSILQNTQDKLIDKDKNGNKITKSINICGKTIDLTQNYKQYNRQIHSMPEYICRILKAIIISSFPLMRLPIDIYKVYNIDKKVQQILDKY